MKEYILEVEPILAEEEDVNNVKKDVKRVHGFGNKGRCSKSNTKKTCAKKEGIIHPPKNPVNKKKSADKDAASTSHKKIIDIDTNEASNKAELDGYRLLHLGVLERLVCTLLCPNCCDNNLYVDIDESQRKGLASYIIIRCRCGYSHGEYTSPVINPVEEQERMGAKTFDINIRSVYAMRSCGQGHSALERFCGTMNMPQPITKKNYSQLSSKLKDGAKYDGSGFASLNGVVVAISTSNFKVLDVKTMSRHCKACASKENIRKSNKEVYDL